MVAMTLITIQSQLEIVYSFSFALLLSSSHVLVVYVFPCWFVQRQVLSFSAVGIDMRFCSLRWLAHFFFFFTAKCKRDVHVFLVAVVDSKFSYEDKRVQVF